MECFVIAVKGFQPLTIITKRFILDVVTVLDPPLARNVATPPIMDKTFRHINVRISENHVSPSIGKLATGNLSISILSIIWFTRDHMIECNQKVARKNIRILGEDSNQHLLEMKETLFIKGDYTSLNRNLQYQDLFLLLYRFIT